MTVSPATRALSRAANALVREYDLTDVVAALLGDVREAMSAGACALMLRTDGGELEVLAATSHRAVELELYQAQSRVGPCPDAVRTGEPVVGVGEDVLLERWGPVGSSMVAAGFLSVHAFPLRWRQQVVGAFNVFHGEHGAPLAEDELMAMGQAYADLAALLVVRPDDLGSGVLHQRTVDALSGRTVIEQAKGVIAYREDVDVDIAYERLQLMAEERGSTLTECAREVLEAARLGRNRLT